MSGKEIGVWGDFRAVSQLGSEVGCLVNPRSYSSVDKYVKFKLLWVSLLNFMEKFRTQENGLKVII